MPSMQLYWSSRSPFVRKVMVVAHETGTVSSIETVRVEVSAVKLSADVMSRNPLNKIPTLVLGDGTVIFDSRVICEYLDSIGSGAKLFPSDPGRRWNALRREAIGSGIMENGVARIGETFRPKELQSEAHLAAYKAKIDAALNFLESEAAALSREPFDIGQVSIGCALSYLDFRYSDDQWRNGRPRLSEWHGVFKQRPSVAPTEHVNVY